MTIVFVPVNYNVNILSEHVYSSYTRLPDFEEKWRKMEQ